MEQANKVLTLFLVLIIAMALAFVLFYKLGLLNKLFPGNKLSLGFLGVPSVVANLTQTPTPTTTPQPTSVLQPGTVRVESEPSTTTNNNYYYNGNKPIDTNPIATPTLTVYSAPANNMPVIASQKPTQVPKTGAETIFALLAFAGAFATGKKLKK